MGKVEVVWGILKVAEKGWFVTGGPIIEGFVCDRCPD
jgi:hypothetical protein